ncbi:putative beta-glucosidase I [Fusarium oxysporum f. sp. albedinis]|nr:putative beta-glucosidase I [Fusarium oxysporum f. sp. albedinis]
MSNSNPVTDRPQWASSLQSMSTCFCRHGRTYPTGRLLFIIVALLIAGSCYSLTPASACPDTDCCCSIHPHDTNSTAHGHLYLNLGERTIPSCLKKHKHEYQCCSTSVLLVWAISSAGLCPSWSASPEAPCRRPTRFVFSPRPEMFHHRRTPCPFPISIHRPALPYPVHFGG